MKPGHVAKKLKVAPWKVSYIAKSLIAARQIEKSQGRFHLPGKSPAKEGP